MQAVKERPVGFEEYDGFHPVGEVTRTIQIVASADDCWRRLYTSLFNTTNTVVSAGRGSPATQIQIGSGMRFQNINVPQGATIVSAYFQRHSRGYQGVAGCNTRISAEDVDNAGDFSGDDAASFDVRYAARTTARVDWDNIPTQLDNTWYDSPDISTVIQEIVNRAGWVSGNSIVIFWEDFDNRSSESANRGGDSYDGAPADAPKLVITLAVGGKLPKLGV